ncbi:hypothetical protein EVAR_20369_1 [Eumeta japonica]|uniref:Uncharacterized protein n=1 Tax=Eumeta variegata TaxID=151549 RepID=A0A4C1VSA6_EUMVA|nr:hypothetical protein EVAR_20369_1 [Eumeta japonica]
MLLPSGGGGGATAGGGAAPSRHRPPRSAVDDAGRRVYRLNLCTTPRPDFGRLTSLRDGSEVEQDALLRAPLSTFITPPRIHIPILVRQRNVIAAGHP